LESVWLNIYFDASGFEVKTCLLKSPRAADGTGRSFMVSKPEGALSTLGIELTTTATVPMSPCMHG
jgi:hypothetical protein